MPLIVDYKRHMGFLTFWYIIGDDVERECFDLYECNGVTAAIEFEQVGDDIIANLKWFLADDHHAKVCMGITRGADGVKGTIFTHKGVEPQSVYFRYREDSQAARQFAKLVYRMPIRHREFWASSYMRSGYEDALDELEHPVTEPVDDELPPTDYDEDLPF